MDELIFSLQTAQEPRNIVMATVEAADTGGVRLRLDGQAAGQKRYMRVQTGMSLAAGDRVIAAKISGTYVVIGAIGATGGNAIVSGLESSARVSALMEEAQRAASEAESARIAAEDALSAALNLMPQEEEDEEADVIKYYDFESAERVVIGDGGEESVILFKKYSTVFDTHIDFHGEIKMLLETTETYDAATNTYTESDGSVLITYLQDGEPVMSYRPAADYLDGTHLLHLLYTWWASGGIDSRFEVMMRCTGCTVTIDPGASRGYIAGAGLLGDNAWDGSVHIYEDFTMLDFGLIHKGIADALSTELITPVSPAASETFQKVNFIQILKTFQGGLILDDTIRYSAAYNDAEMEKYNVTTQDGMWVNSDTGIVGTVTTPVTDVPRILKVTSNHVSGAGDTSYVVSFDEGETWWYWSDRWSIYESGYGMVETALRAIPAKQWKEKLIATGKVMIRSLLQTDAALLDIQIITSDAEERDSSSHLDIVCQDYYSIKSRDQVDLRYEYLYQSQETSIDIGRMSQVDIDTTIYSEVTEIYAHARKTGI